MNRERPQIGTPAVRRALAGQEVPANLSMLGPARIQDSQPGALGPERGTWVRLPGENFAPAGSIPVDETGDGNIAAAGSATIITLTVPTGLRFRLAGIGFSAEDETALAFLSWSITAPDAVPGYINKPAAIGSVRQLADVFYVAGSDATVNVIAASSAAAVVTYHFYCRIRGWFYAEKEGA